MTKHILIADERSQVRRALRLLLESKATEPEPQ